MVLEGLRGLQPPRVWAETLNKPDFERIKELKALINGIFMKEGEVNIWGRAGLSWDGKCKNNCPMTVGDLMALSHS